MLPRLGTSTIPLQYIVEAAAADLPYRLVYEQLYVAQAQTDREKAAIDAIVGRIEAQDAAAAQEKRQRQVSQSVRR